MEIESIESKGEAAIKRKQMAAKIRSVRYCSMGWPYNRSYDTGTMKQYQTVGAHVVFGRFALGARVDLFCVQWNNMMDERTTNPP